MHNRKKIIYYIFLSLSAFLLVSGTIFLYRINHTENNQSIGKVTAILNNEQNLYWGKTWEGLRNEASSVHLELSEYQVDNTESIADYLEIALLSETDGIIFNPSNLHDQEALAFLQQAYDTGIKLIALDTAYEELPVFSLTSDTISSSQTVIDYLLKYITDEEVLLLTYDVYYSLPLEIRTETIRSVLEQSEYKDHFRIFQIPHDKVELREALTDYISSSDKETYLICPGPQQTLISAQTISSLGAASQFHLIGYGETDEAINYVKSGIIEALLIQDSYQMGCLAIDYLNDAIQGAELPDETIYIDNFLCTQDTLNKLM